MSRPRKAPDSRKRASGRTGRSFRSDIREGKSSSTDLAALEIVEYSTYPAGGRPPFDGEQGYTQNGGESEASPNDRLTGVPFLEVVEKAGQFLLVEGMARARARVDSALAEVIDQLKVK